MPTKINLKNEIGNTYLVVHMNLDKISEKQLLLSLVIVALLTRLPLISFFPLVLDEAIYGMIIADQLEHPTLVPTLFDYPVFWKPQLFYWIYAFFVGILKGLPISIEAVYRLPSHLFGLFNIVLLYYLLKSININKQLSFLTALIYSLIYLNVYVANSLLADTLLNTFILGSLFLYFNKNLGDRRFLLAGLLVFAAYFVKLIAAFIIPLLAVAYFYFNNKKTLKNKFFIISLLFVPVAAFVHYQIYADVLESHELREAFNKEVFERNKLTLVTTYFKIFGTANTFVYVNVWVIFSALGLLKFWRDNKFMAAWYAVIIVILTSSSFLPWYYVVVLPPISYFSLIYLVQHQKKIILDRFFYVALAIMLSGSFLIGFFYHIDELLKPFEYQREAGKFLAFKENVYIIGVPPQTMIAYKVLEEKRAGKDVDFGWVLMSHVKLYNITNFTTIKNYMDDYHYVAKNMNTTNGSFARAYWDYGVYKKDTNIKKPKIIAIVGFENGTIDKKLIREFTNYAGDKVRIYEN